MASSEPGGASVASRSRGATVGATTVSTAPPLKRYTAAYTSPRSASLVTRTGRPAPPSAAWARAMSDEAVSTGNPRESASALARLAPTRSPVKLPGPSARSTPRIPERPMPDSSRSRSRIGSTAAACRRAPSRKPSRAEAKSSPIATEARSVAVSIASQVRGPPAPAGPGRPRGAAGSDGSAAAPTPRPAPATRSGGRRRRRVAPSPDRPPRPAT